MFDLNCCLLDECAFSVCLLSVLFLLPYCYKGHTPLLLKLGSAWLVTYSCLVLPLLISANYKYPVRWLRQITAGLPTLARNLMGPAWRFLRRAYVPLDKCERIFMEMSNLSNLATQLVFFLMCDRVLLCDFGGKSCPQKRITGLYTMMFYNVLAYCLSYIKELVDKEDWSPYVTMTQHSNLKHLAMSATKIVLEWTKAVTFIITLTFMLLVFGLEQGLEHYHPTIFYTFVTGSYYICTEKVFIQFFPSILLFLRLNVLEALELLYAPILLRYYTVSLAAICGFLLLCQGQFRLAFFATYLTVYLRAKDTLNTHLKKLRTEQALLGRFRKATPDDICNWDDVCAVCLCPMERARITPCQHLFHADCLRQCLKNSTCCPICKREFTFLSN